MSVNISRSYLQAHLLRIFSYKDVLDGLEMVSYMVTNQVCATRMDAVCIGRALVACGVLNHVTREHHFHDEEYFYHVDAGRWAMVREK